MNRHGKNLPVDPFPVLVLELELGLVASSGRGVENEPFDGLGDVPLDAPGEVVLAVGVGLGLIVSISEGLAVGPLDGCAANSESSVVMAGISPKAAP